MVRNLHVYMGNNLHVFLWYITDAIVVQWHLYGTQIMSSWYTTMVTIYVSMVRNLHVSMVHNLHVSR